MPKHASFVNSWIRYVRKHMSKEKTTMYLVKQTNTKETQNCPRDEC